MSLNLKSVSDCPHLQRASAASTLCRWAGVAGCAALVAARAGSWAGATNVPRSALKDESVLLQFNVQSHSKSSVATIDFDSSLPEEYLLTDREWNTLAAGAAATSRGFTDDLCSLGALGEGCGYSSPQAPNSTQLRDRSLPASHGSPLSVPAPLTLHTQLLLFQEYEMLGRAAGSASAAAGGAALRDKQPQRPLSWEAVLLLGVYGVLYGVVAGSIMYYMSTEVKEEQKKAAAAKGSTTVEDRTWQESSVRWFMNSWATLWTSKWGHSLDAAMTKIKPDELPSSISADKHPSLCSLRFDRAWEEEIARAGPAGARALPVILRFCGYGRLLYGTMLFLCKTLSKDLYVVILLELAIKFFRWLQEHNAHHPSEPVPLPPMILAAVFFFSLHPLGIIFFYTLHARIMRDLEQEVCGGLGVAMYRKALRLPVCSAREAGEDGKEGREAPDLKQLIINDVCGNVWKSYHNLNDATYCAFQLAVMFILLWRHVRTSALLVVAGIWPIALLLSWTSRRIAESMGSIMYVEDIRNGALQEMFFAIRVAKSNAWEDSMQKKIGEIRSVHLDCISTFFSRQMLMATMLAVSPKFLAVLTLASYLLLYGALDVSAIFVIIQIVNVIRGSTDNLTRCITDLITVSISLERIESFLKLEEAPLRRRERPKYFKLWPSRESLATSSLQLHGSWRWTPDGPERLQDVHVEVPRGSLVAVCGEVGGGKSTLLQAVLGELYPAVPADSCLSRPDVVAYCPQNPVIYEGTLKENVLYGAEFEEDKYRQALEAAALTQDLEHLPDGDNVPIGARGIVLSGGQKARVQLARAAYCTAAELLLLDDPFASVDAPTGDRIFSGMLLGPLAQGRTRLVALQPDRERIARFDHVIVVAGGRIVAQGKPKEVMASSHFQALLRSEAQGEAAAEAPGEAAEALAAAEERPPRQSPPQPQQPAKQQAQLREEEEEGRPSLRHVEAYVMRGRWYYITLLIACLAGSEVCNLAGNLVLARWANRQAASGVSSSWLYVLGYVGCGVGIGVSTLLTWLFVQLFSLNVSKSLHEDTIGTLLQAPIDRFYDKHPVGRIMNRMTNDMRTVDRSLLFTATCLFIVIGQLCVPVAYVHSVMPFFFTIWVVPTYYIIALLWFRYWNTTVPIAYSRLVCISTVMGHITDAHEHSIIVRAYDDEGRAAAAFARSCSNSLKVIVSGGILEGWFMSRVEVLWNFCTTFVVLFALVCPGRIGVGTLGLCLTNMMMVQNNFLTLCSGASGLMSDFISFVRLHEYLEIPQERPPHVEGDQRYRNLVLSCPRESLGKLQVLRDGTGVLRVCQCSAGTVPEALFHASQDGSSLVPTRRLKDMLPELCPGNTHVQALTQWHAVASVNGARHNATALAEELCTGKSDKVMLDVRSGWLAGGTRVEIQNLVVGYADIPKEVLRGISFTIEARTKVGIVGATGCGKSTLLLALLRILEPRSGRILFNNVDTLNVGVRTLRSAVGLVAQDPVLFSGSVRYNLDPHGAYTDEQVLQALGRVQMKGFVEGLQQKLEHPVSEGGENISFGQRQLVCLARLVLRRPALMLLDEATSSIDPRTQEIVTEVLHKDFAQSTIIAVAHRIETVVDYDRVVVLKEGTVAEQGRPRELAERKGGAFAEMLALRRKQCA